MDPVDPKRRGRRLFGGRRRHEHAAEAEMNEPTTTTVPDAPASGTPPASGGDEAAAPSDGAPSPRSAPVDTLQESERPAPDDLEVEIDEIEVVNEAEPDPDAPSGDATVDDRDADNGVPEPVVDAVTETATAAATVDPVTTAATEASTEASPAAEAAPGADDAAEPSEEDADEDAVEPYDLPRIVAIANQKGGVGKTTTSVNLGAALAEMGFRVLVVDLDPQGNATTGLGVNARELEGSVYDVIMNDAPVEDCVEPTSLKNLFVVPATIDLAGAEIELVPAFSRELKLRRALHEIRDDYDYMIIDCPPSLGLLTVNGLAAADDVIVPIQCEYYALEGLSQLIRNVSLVQKNLNPSLDVRGIVLTMYDARTKLADQVEQEVRNHFGRTVYQTVVPRTVRLSEAPSFGQPIILFDPTSRGAVAYRELAKEVSSGATRRTG
jgi:chromosome partitioning protein